MMTMRRSRPAAVAGHFYPADPETLLSQVRAFLEHASAPPGLPVQPPKAIIAPHAGYLFSGPIAGSAYRTVAAARERIRRVVLIGPCHRIPIRGIALPEEEAFESPLGPVPIDGAAVEACLALPFVTKRSDAHAFEHSLEVHLPFLQVLLRDFELVAMVVGDATGEEVARVLELAWGGDETLIVISSDLSHFHDYDTARTMDRATTEAIETLEPSHIDSEGACGRLPIAGLLLTARRHGLSPTTLDLRSSGDTAGMRDRVVGYGAWAFHREAERQGSRAP